MKTAFKRTKTPLIPGYSENAVLQLIIACGVGFILFFFTLVCFQAFGKYSFPDARALVIPYVALPQAQDFPAHFWTLFTYGWVHHGFWEWLTNMVWLYCFGSVVQSLVGHRQIIPMFIYSLLAGGLFYLAGSLLAPGAARPPMGAQAGLMGLAVAAVVIAPKYRFYIGPNFSIPLMVVAILFGALAVLNATLHLPNLMLLAGGGLTGLAYVRLLRAGKRPGGWIYDWLDKSNKIFTPDEDALRAKRNQKRNQVLSRMYEPKGGVSQHTIDELLDQINQHGYNALSREEKDALMRASKESNP